MFQFPGFAFLTLCIQVKNTWFSSLKTTCAVYNELSGGLPHSEIHGSQLILSSPWLIAEYHVLHRLLLPRHSPNALLALDLIQKKTGLLHFPASRPEGQLDQKHTFPLQAVRAWNCRSPCGPRWLVYLTWIVHCICGAKPPDICREGRQSIQCT